MPPRLARTGTVSINEASVWEEGHVPFGGAAGKGSGIGRNGGRHPMEQVYAEQKTIFLHVG